MPQIDRMRRERIAGKETRMFVPISLERDQPLQRLLYERLLNLSISGRLHQGVRMPSSGMVAERLAIARITVLLTCERLTVEGLLESRSAGGTFFCGSRPSTRLARQATASR